jgi:phosphoenolpyruvate carboxykinase (ATP)
MTQQRAVDVHGLTHHFLDGLSPDHWNAVTPALYEHAARRQEGLIAHLGPLVVRTGERTGRSPRDKFVVREPGTEDQIWWAGNQSFKPEQFDWLHRKVLAYLDGREIFVQDCCAGADRHHRRSVRFVTELAWHNLFVRNLFIHQPLGRHLADEPDVTVIAVPHFQADPEVDGTNSEAFVLIHLGKRLS